ncbi:MAG: hypothetical protein HKN46_03740 [Acidimicrobiia bacterium]|nr:hypothetical protein [Acidimicrobiia bacterium]
MFQAELTTPFLGNAAVALALLYLFGLLEQRTARGKQQRIPLQGLLFGTMASLAMAVGMDIAEGFVHDARNTILLLAGMFGGPWVAGIAYVIAMATRAAIGLGPGLLTAIASSAAAATIGAIGHGVVVRRGNAWTLGRSAIAAAVAFGAMIPIFAAAPLANDTKWPAIWAITVVFAPASVIGAIVLQRARDRVALEQRLSVAARTLQEAPIPQFWADASQRVVWANDAAIESLDLNVGDLWNRMLCDDEDRISDRVAELAPGEDLATSMRFRDTEGTTRTGELVAFRSATPLQGSEPWCFSVRDLHEIESSRDRLAEALEARNRFLSSVSHELRTPIAGVFGYTEILGDPEANLDDDMRREMREALSEAGIRVSDVLSDLDLSSRLSAGGVELMPTPTDLRRVIERVIDFHPGWDFDVSFETDDTALTVDAIRIEQVIRNLMENAVTHGGERRRLRVTRADERLVVCICDDGDGVQEDISPFVPFETTGHSTGDYPALGMGLWVSSELADRMGGAVEYERSDDWTHFRLLVPVGP